MEDKLIEIGYISKAHGIRGEVMLHLFDGEASFLSAGEKVLIGQKRFFIQSFKPHKEAFILSLKELNDRNQAESLRGKKVLVSSEIFKKSENLYLNQVLNYAFYVDQKIHGHICGFASTPAHEILRIKTKNAKILEIPYVPSFILEVDHEKQKIVATVPLELLDPDFLSSRKKEEGS